MTESPNRLSLTSFLVPVLLIIGILGCTPTVKVAVPSEPITINLNVKIEHEIRIKVDKELTELFETEDDLF